MSLLYKILHFKCDMYTVELELLKQVVDEMLNSQENFLKTIFVIINLFRIALV